MKYVLIIHEVEDYQKWKQVFDSAAAIRKDAGEISYQLLKFELEANQIVHFSAWTTLEKAKMFFESDELVQIRKDAGVKAPQFIYLEKLEEAKL